jgi:hypothetical protein
VPEAEIEVAYTDPATRARLLATRKPSNTPKVYFRYDTFADERERCDALIENLVGLLPQIFAWFKDGTVGPNIAPY